MKNTIILKSLHLKFLTLKYETKNPLATAYIKYETTGQEMYILTNETFM